MWKPIIWHQLGAAIDMLENSLIVCPDEIWSDGSKLVRLWSEHSQKPMFWYLVFHTLFWLDFYLTDSPENFVPPAPFTLDELDPAGLLPERVYSKAELQIYLEYCRQKCRTKIENMTDETAKQRFISGSFNISFFELLLYNMRHVQHHTAQLNLLLRQQTNSAPGWIGRTKSEISI